MKVYVFPLRLKQVVFGFFSLIIYIQFCVDFAASIHVHCVEQTLEAMTRFSLTWMRGMTSLHTGPSSCVHQLELEHQKRTVHCSFHGWGTRQHSLNLVIGPWLTDWLSCCKLQIFSVSVPVTVRLFLSLSLSACLSFFHTYSHSQSSLRAPAAALPRPLAH